MIVGAAVLPYAELNSALVEARIRLKARVEGDKKAQGIDILFHYTDRQSALAISAFQTIIASDAKRFGGFTFPSGAYATDIPPWSVQSTQRQMSALFYGGNENRDVSHFVAIKKNDFLKLHYPGFPNQFYRPAPPGDSVSVEVITFGPNLMLR